MSSMGPSEIPVPPPIPPLPRLWRRVPSPPPLPPRPARLCDSEKETRNKNKKSKKSKKRGKSKKLPVLPESQSPSAEESAEIERVEPRTSAGEEESPSAGTKPPPLPPLPPSKRSSVDGEPPASTLAEPTRPPVEHGGGHAEDAGAGEPSRTSPLSAEVSRETIHTRTPAATLPPSPRRSPSSSEASSITNGALRPATPPLGQGHDSSHESGSGHGGDGSRGSDGGGSADSDLGEGDPSGAEQDAVATKRAENSCRPRPPSPSLPPAPQGVVRRPAPDDHDEGGVFQGTLDPLSGEAILGTGPLTDPRLQMLANEEAEFALLEYYERDRTPQIPVSPILMSGEYVAGEVAPVDAQRRCAGHFLPSALGPDGGVEVTPVVPFDSAGDEDEDEDEEDGGTVEAEARVEGDVESPGSDSNSDSGGAGGEREEESGGGASEDAGSESSYEEDNFMLPPMRVVLTPGPDWAAIGFRVTQNGDTGDVIIEHGTHVALEALRERTERAALMRSSAARPGAANRDASNAVLPGDDGAGAQDGDDGGAEASLPWSLPPLSSWNPQVGRDRAIAAGSMAVVQRRNELILLGSWIVLALAFLSLVVAVATIVAADGAECAGSFTAVPLMSCGIGALWMGIGPVRALSARFGRRVRTFFSTYSVFGTGWAMNLASALALAAVLTAIVSLIVSVGDDGAACRDGVANVWRMAIAAPLCVASIISLTHLVCSVLAPRRDLLLEDALG